MRILAVLAALSLVVLATESKVVTRNINGKVYAHIMPWFDTPASQGFWGIHWTMANKNPDIIENGRRQIAAHYYPDIEPYASGDQSVVEYQLLTMRYAGIDGVLIDWPGTVNAWDYPQNLRNSEAIIQGCNNIGMEWAIVYEDHNIKMAYDAGFITNQIQAAQNDMSYMRDRYFNNGNYIKYNGAPLLLVFGPQAFKSPAQWNEIFSPLPQRPTFLTLWYQGGEAAAQGEYNWIYFDFLEGLRHYYNNHQPGIKMGNAYPGFNSFYDQGGWPGPGWGIPMNTQTFEQTLDLAINANVPFIQLATWNDYGEGTIVEPTKEWGNQFLNILQGKLGLPWGNHELGIVKSLYNKRKEFAGLADKQSELDKVAALLSEYEPEQANAILSKL